MRRGVKLNRSDMHGYQNEGVDFIKARPASALFIDLGMGKTAISATAALDLLVSGEINRVLIVAPKRVAVTGWRNEFSEWGHLCYYNISVIDGTDKERLAALDVKSLFYSVSVDNLAWLIEHYKTKFPFDMVILDESSMFKSHTSQRFKKLRRVRKYIKRLVELTATPAAEGYMGIFAQTYLLDEGERFGSTISAYQDNYFTQNRYNFKWKLRPGAEDEIIRKIADICLVMKAEDYLDMKGLNFVPVPVKLPVELSEKYLEMEEDSLIEIMPDDFDELIDEPITIEAEQAASLQAKLLQMCSGFIYDTKITGITADDKVIKQKDDYQLHDLKFDALEELLATELADKNVLIAYHFKPTLARLKERFKKLEVMDKKGDIIKKWNSGKIKLLAAHPQSAGHGLNLQRGGHVIVYVDNPWSLERFLQFNGRLNRQGQEHPVMVYQLKAMLTAPDGTSRDTVDATVIEALNSKQDVQERFLERLEEIKGRVKKRKKSKSGSIWDDEED